MSFDWSEYLNLANKLVQAKSTPSADEACQRTAISRAYYAAYCLVRNLARDRGWVTLIGGARDHAIVKNHFKNSACFTNLFTIFECGTKLLPFLNRREHRGGAENAEKKRPGKASPFHGIFNLPKASPEGKNRCVLCVFSATSAV